MTNNPIETFMSNPVRRRIRYGFITAALLIALGFALTLYSYSQYGKDRGRIEQTQRVYSQAQTILGLLTDMETGVRGYMATKDADYLEPHNAALPQVWPQINALRKLVEESPYQTRNVDSLMVLTRDKLNIMERQRAALEKGDPPSILNSYTLVGKVHMDRIRRLIAVMLAQERALMEQRTAAASQSFRNTVILTFLLSLLTFIALILSYNLLENELTTRQQTEEQLRTYEEELRVKIRLLETSNEELERFAFVASHDMQEPLRKIQSFSYLVRDKYEPQLEAEGKLYVSKILQSAERMSKMIKDLLNFSRISTKQEPFHPVPLEDIIAGILSDQELRIAALGARIQVGDLPVLDAVPDQMDHLFTNLISNALKFKKEDQPPVIKITASRVDGGAWPELIAGKNYYEIRVEDNGIGFEEKYLDHIFKIFQRLHGKSAYEGTGIGLAICKRIVNNHRGLITAHSRPGVGTTFIVLLPENQNQPRHDATTIHETRSHLVGR